MKKSSYAGKRLHDPVELEKSDWEEIAANLFIKRVALKRGDYQPCMEHGAKCKSCDLAWIEQIDRILEAIGPDGDEAAERGVAPCN